MGFAMGIGRFLLSGLFGLGRLIRAAWDWLAEKPVRILIAVLLVAIAVQHVVIGNRTEQRDEALASAAGEKASRLKTIDNYRVAAREAKRLQEERNLRVAKEQAVINGRILNDYETRLGDVRARADRLRHQLLAQAAGSGAGSAGLSGPSDATGSAPEAPRDPRLPPSGDAFVISEMRLDERLTATMQAIQLEALIDWVEAQGAVDVNADPAGQ